MLGKYNDPMEMESISTMVKLHVYFTDRQIDDIRGYAYKQGLSFSEMFRRILDLGLKEMLKQEAPVGAPPRRPSKGLKADE
jgi:hypothetical protein